MPYFAMQIWTGAEGKYLALARIGWTPPVKLIWPRRNLRIKRRGVWQDSLAPIFPSYIFIEAESIEPDSYRKLRYTPGFIRFLLANNNIVPMEKKDQDLLNHFLGYGEIVDKSFVVFDADKRIRVVSGPLKGLEGRIVKVDRRKGRAKVKLEMYRDSFNVDFGFEVLEVMPSTPSPEPPTP
jgi:transcriptional antiterminator NusG